MKKILCLLASCVLTIHLFAQAPQRLSYQAIVRNANNVLVTNAPIRMRISILQGSITGTAVYTELHSTTTNASGVAFIEVGGGTSPVGSFAAINWGQGPYFLRSETDPNNGTNYTIVGTTQLLSVPYALQSNRAARADSASHAVRSTRADSAARAGNGLPPTSSYGALQLFNCNGVVQYSPCLPRLTTATIDSITLSTAVSGGNISEDGGAAVTARGVVWSTAQNPTVALATKTSNGTGRGTFKSNLTGLIENTTYFVRAYATNSAGTAYGNQLSFRTLGRPPAVITNTISAVTTTTATCGGNVTDSGSTSVTARGIVWSTTQNPTIALATKTSDGTGVGNFTSSITGLTPGTTYYVRAYAVNTVGTAYGAEVSFRTTSPPTVTTTSSSSISGYGANTGGNVTNDGGSAVTERGVVWSTAQNPTIALATKLASGTGLGSFSLRIPNLTPNTLYYARAYAINAAGTAYGAEISFRTARIPLVTTTSISSVTNTTATGGGNVTDSGSAPITARGVVWGTSQNPTIALATKTNNGTGIGSFTSNITGLTPGTTYFVRAYATSSAGTSYGAQVSFTTLSPYAVGTVHCNNTPTAIVEVTNPATGRTWMDRNLGASRAATSSTDTAAYGDLYQWGRRADGHQCRNSATSSVLSSADQPSNGNFILTPILPYDWRNPQNNSLWQGVNGTNNPCPSGFRLPTVTELEAERGSWSSNNASGAYASQLKWALSGSRNNSTASINDVGVYGNYWSSNVRATDVRYLVIENTNAYANSLSRGDGISVRCIKDLPAAITALGCSTATHNGTLTAGTVASGVSSVVSYTGGNGGTYNGQIINSTGVTGLTANLPAGTLVSGNGTLTYTITGTPATSGTASFAISIGGQSCTLSRTVNAATVTGITAHSCGAANVHNPNIPYGTMTDQQGNVYRTVQIGNQVWMAENLRTTVYRNNTPVQNITDDVQWLNNTTGAYCSISNNTSADCPNGKLYNWYALVNNNNLCPTGWHVSSDSEWNILIKYLDPLADISCTNCYQSQNGYQLKSTGTQYWISPNLAANNFTGLSCLPSGVRMGQNESNPGSFYGTSIDGVYWTSTSVGDTNFAYSRALTSSISEIIKMEDVKTRGAAVRCVKD